MSAGMLSQCPFCIASIPIWRREACPPYRWLHLATNGHAYDCGNYDAENRHITEPFGLFVFAWLPKLCRNGKLRWLCCVEQHREPTKTTYTLGNRAH